MSIRTWAILIILSMASIAVFSPGAFTAETASKDAILQEVGSLADERPEILRGIILSTLSAYRNEGRIDEGIALSGKALKIFPDNEEILNSLGGFYIQKRDYPKAAEIYARLARIAPENIWYLQMISQSYSYAGDRENAKNAWDALMKKSVNPAVFAEAADFYNTLGDTDKAISLMGKAIELGPEKALYPRKLAEFYAAAGKFGEAEAVCEKIIGESEEKQAKLWANTELINIYQRQGRLEELAARFEKDLSLAPSEPPNYIRLALLYQKNNERDRALEIYERAVTAGINSPDINKNLLDMYEELNQSDKAEKLLRNMIAVAPRDAGLYERLANILTEAGKKEGAKKAWQEFLEKAPDDNGRAFSKFGDRLKEWGELDEAIIQYKRAQSIDPGNLRYAMAVADILIGKEMFGEAKKELENIAAAATDERIKEEAKGKIDDIARKEAGSKVKSAPEKMPASIAAETKSAGREEPAKKRPGKKKKWGFF